MQILSGNACIRQLSDEFLPMVDRSDEDHYTRPTALHNVYLRTLIDRRCMWQRICDHFETKRKKMQAAEAKNIQQLLTARAAGRSIPDR